jgi:Phage envelope protein
MHLEALKLAKRIGGASAVRELSLYESQLYSWHSKQQQLRENELATENVRLKRQQAKQTEGLAIIQNGRSIPREAPEMTYIFIKMHQVESSCSVALTKTLRAADVRINEWILLSLPEPVHHDPVVMQGQPLVTNITEVRVFKTSAVIHALHEDQTGKTRFPQFLAAI